MSIRLPTIDLTSAVVGTTAVLNWQQTTGQSANSRFYGSQTVQGAGANAAHLFLLNESGCELLVDMSTGETFVLPAGGWHIQELQPSTTSLRYTVDAVLNGALVNKLYSVWYAPHETPPRTPILGNSPIGGSVATTTTTVLLGPAQNFGLTEIDEFTDGPGPGLIPTRIGASAVPLYLLVRDGSGNPVIVAIMDTTTLKIAVKLDTGAFGISTSGLIVNGSGAVVLTGKVTLYDNQNVFGEGVAPIRAALDNQLIVGTTLTQIVQITTPNDGVKHSYRVRGWVTVANSVSGNNVAFQCVYTRPNGTGRTTALPMWAGAAAAVLSGAISITNGVYEGVDLYITCNPNTNITIQYQDPTNVPADAVSASIEQIS